MSPITSSGQTAGESAATSEFEGEIREFVRKDVAPWRKRGDRAEVARADAGSVEAQADSVSVLVQRVAGASLNELDSMIEELRSMREWLRAEGERVQREIAGYATMSHTAAASMKAIAESMAQWRTAAGMPPPFRG
jgi:hypothetical protein